LSHNPKEPIVAKEGSASRRIYLSPPHMSQFERAYLADAFDSNWIAPLGPHVDAFEKEFAAKIGEGEAAALSSGTAALHLSLMLLGVGRGDEVLTSTLTFAATANAITYVGATPVFIDSDRETWNMDPGLLAEELHASARRGKLPKAVVVVDLYGQCADYEPILDACRHYNVPVVEDAAEALGATYRGRSAGAFGLLSCFSFNGNKIITTSGGGMLLSDRKDLVAKARFLATQARDPAPHYEHSHIGYNYRMSNLLAAVGRGQLRVLDDRVERRRANYEFYRQTLDDVPGVRFMPEHPEGRSTRWLTCITIDPAEFGATREDVRLMLERHNVESRPTWKPMHLQPVFSGCRVRGGSVSEEIFDYGLCLPSGSSLAEEDRLQVADLVRQQAGCPRIDVAAPAASGRKAA
jgi:pyridoxal phosphate-dependent aminotransferase EpsN